MGTPGGKVWTQPHLRLRAGHPQTKGLWGLVAKVRPGCDSANQSTGCAPGTVGAVGQARCRDQTAGLGRPRREAKLTAPLRPEVRAVKAAFLEDTTWVKTMAHTAQAAPGPPGT